MSNETSKTHQTNSPENNRRPSRRRLWLFRILAIALGFSPFVVLELALRIADYPPEHERTDPFADLHQLEPLFVPASRQSTANTAAAASPVTLEIPSWRMNYFRPASLTMPKPADEFRIFVLGGSTTQGRPYATETAYGKWLELSLQASDPTRDWRVINCGGVSYASYRVAAILEEVLNYQPDLTIVYTGHNEFLEDRVYGNWKDVPEGLVRVARPLNDLYVTRMVTHWLRRDEEPMKATAPRWTASKEVDTRLDHVGGLDQYQRDVDWRSSVIAHFRQSLTRMIEASQQAKVPLILCTPVANIRDTPPFKIERSPDITGQAAIDWDREWEEATNPNTPITIRLEITQRLLATDIQHAGAAFLRGRLLLATGETAEANRWLQQACDWDVCPLRAPSEIVQATREIADQRGILLVDVVADCREIAEDGIVGDKLLVDHVHPSPETHQRIAGWILDAMKQQGWVSRTADFEARQRGLYSDHWSTLGEEYFARGQQRLAGLRNWAAGRAGKITPPQDAEGE